MNEPEVIERVLRDSRVWVVVGASPDALRDSHRISRLLVGEGKVVVPINPAVDEIAGRTAYPSLLDVPDDLEIDVVDIFRRSDRAGRHVDEAIERGATAVWMQLGVIDHAAARRAEAAGVEVIMDRCPAIEFPALR
jgi:predicted CoA-binding protein